MARCEWSGGGEGEEEGDDGLGIVRGIFGMKNLTYGCEPHLGENVGGMFMLVLRLLNVVVHRLSLLRFGWADMKLNSREALLYIY